MRSGRGTSPGEAAPRCSCGSRITTGSAAARSSTPRYSRIWNGSGSGLISDPSARRTRMPSPHTRSSLEQLRADGLIYGCDCTRATFARWAAEHGRPWSGPGCPGDCRERGVGGPVMRATLGGGHESWTDRIVGERQGDVAANGDLPVLDRHGNWTYGFCVVVDDLRQGVDLVVRGEDLLEATRRADPARTGARTRDATRVRPPPARPATGWQQALEIGRRHRRARAPGSGSCAERGRRACCIGYPIPTEPS